MVVTCKQSAMHYAMWPKFGLNAFKLVAAQFAARESAFGHFVDYGMPVGIAIFMMLGDEHVPEILSGFAHPLEHIGCGFTGVDTPVFISQMFLRRHCEGDVPRARPEARLAGNTRGPMPRLSLTAIVAFATANVSFCVVGRENPSGQPLRGLPAPYLSEDRGHAIAAYVVR